MKSGFGARALARATMAGRVSPARPFGDEAGHQEGGGASGSGRGSSPPGPMAWPDLVGAALVAFAVSRLVVLVGAATASSLRPHLSFLDVLTLWDAPYYLEIMTQGYPAPIPVGPDGRAAASPIAFFPAYPLLAGAVDVILPGDEVLAALVTSTLLGAAATVAVAVLVARGWGLAAGRRAALLFAVFPGSIVLSMPYAEGLMVGAVTLCLLALQRRWWVVAGVAGAVATASRPTAAAVIVACAWAAGVAIREQRQLAALCAPVLAAGGFVGFHLYLWAHTGELGAWFRVEHEAWHQVTDLGLSTTRGPLWELVTLRPDGALGLGRGVLILLAGAGLVALVHLRPPGPIVVYTAVALALTAISGMEIAPRFLLAAFPLIVPAAVRLDDHSTSLVVTVTAGLTGLYVIYSTLSYEVYFGLNSSGL